MSGLMPVARFQFDMIKSKLSSLMANE